MHSLIPVTHTRDCVNAIRGMRVTGTPDKLDRQAEYRAWIRQSIAETGETQTSFYKKAGLDAATGSRHLGEGSNVKIRPETIDALARYWRLAPPLIHDMHANGAHLSDSLLPYEGPLTASDKLAHSGQSHWLIKDRSVERLGFVPGDIVTVDERINAEHNDVVSVQLVDMQGGSTQRVLRRFVQERAASERDRLYVPAFVVTATNDPSVDDVPRQVDQRNVAIKGVIVKRVWVRHR